MAAEVPKRENNPLKPGQESVFLDSRSGSMIVANGRMKDGEDK